MSSTSYCRHSDCLNFSMDMVGVCALVPVPHFLQPLPFS